MAQFWLPGDSDFALAMREPNLLVPNRQPSGTVSLNRRHWLAPHLVGSAFVSPYGPIDVVRDIPLTRTVSTGSLALSPLPSPAGGLALTRYGTYIEYPAYYYELTGLSGIDFASHTLFCAVYEYPDIERALISAGASDAYESEIYINANDTVQGVVRWRTVTSAAQTLGGFAIYALVSDTGGVYLYRNGTQIASGTSVPSATANIDRLTIGEGYVSGAIAPWRSLFNGGFIFGGLLDIALSAEQTILFSKNVFALLRPPDQSLFLISVPAGGGATGTGDLIGSGSEVVGVGKRTVTGTGALVAQGSVVVGVGERIVTGSGDLVGAGAEVSGTGAVGGITTGTGDLVGAGSEVVGTGIRTVTGTGALVAQGSAVTGTGERVITGAGALVGSGSEIVGTGVGGDVKTGAGALVGQGSAVTGTGTRKITGVGELVAAGSIIVGAGVRTITGSGALVGAGSEIVGTYVATIVEPSLFQTAANTIIDVFAAAHGQTITLALDSGTVTITGFMRKRPKDWDTPDGKTRGSGWQIVCKGWEISSSDLEGMSGKRATVDGDAYYIVSATPKTSGTLVLDVGYAN